VTTRISAVIDTDGQQCGNRCCQQPDPKGGAFCTMFSTPLHRALGGGHDRCPACLRAEKRLRRDLSAARVEGRMAAAGGARR
jgi:predicted amidophosphoribosyltransferase